MTVVARPRLKKCRNPACGASFTPSMTTQKVCSWKCGLAIAPTQRQRAERELHKIAKERIKGRKEYLREAQTAFNAWVRLRDHGLPCISCGTTADIQYAAGHYRSAGGHPELRFEPLNVHLQCNRNCNMAKSGNLGPYRVELIRRIGLEKVEWLEGPHEPKRYSIEELKEITEKYRALARELRKKHELS